MSSPLKYAPFCLAGLAAACGDASSNPAAPSAAESPPAAEVQNALVAPAIGLTAHALYYCYTPVSNRMCVILKRKIEVTSSSTTPLTWTALSNYPWIVVSPAQGTTPVSVTVSVDPRKLPARRPVYGSLTIAAAAASNSPQKISVYVNAVGRPLSLPALAFSDSAIGFCYNPTSTRACVRLSEQVGFLSTGTALTWRAVASHSWIVVQPAGGTTPADVRVSVDFAKLPSRNGATSISGWITVSATGASNSPQTIPVKLQYYSQPLPQ
jgi:BACON domain-containing protein